MSNLEKLKIDSIPENIIELLEKELITPVVLSKDSSLRIKVTDSCGMACTFCHNEGTPVSSDHQRLHNGRVSIFESYNGVTFSASPFIANDKFVEALSNLARKLRSNELHWTGGEPTLNPSLVELTEMARTQGYRIKMTSNGETGKLKISQLASAGLESINFSIFGTTPEEIAAVQSARFRNNRYGAMKLQKLEEAIHESIESNIKVKANIVIRDKADYIRATRILEKFGQKVELRLLPSLDDGFTSLLAIYGFLSEIAATPITRYITAGSSNSRIGYVTPEGFNIGFKQIDRVTLPDSCDDCSMNNVDECKEGYYGIRLYCDESGRYKVGICIQRMDLVVDLEEFLSGDISSEILDFRDKEYVRLAEEYADFCVWEQ